MPAAERQRVQRFPVVAENDRAGRLRLRQELRHHAVHLVVIRARHGFHQFGIPHDAAFRHAVEVSFETLQHAGDRQHLRHITDPAVPLVRQIADRPAKSVVTVHANLVHALRLLVPAEHQRIEALAEKVDPLPVDPEPHPVRVHKRIEKNHHRRSNGIRIFHHLIQRHRNDVHRNPGGVSLDGFMKMPQRHGILQKVRRKTLVAEKNLQFLQRLGDIRPLPVAGRDPSVFLQFLAGAADGDVAGLVNPAKLLDAGETAPLRIPAGTDLFQNVLINLLPFPARHRRRPFICRCFYYNT